MKKLTSILKLLLLFITGNVQSMLWFAYLYKLDASNNFKFTVYYLGSIHKNLAHFETLHASEFSHNIVKRGVNDSPHPLNKVKEVSFTTLGR